MKKRKLKLHKRKIPLEMVLALRSKHSVKESAKVYKRNKTKIFPFDDDKNNYHQTDFLFDNFVDSSFKVIKRFCPNYTIYNFPIFE
jgi:hypothetical protein